MENATLTLDQQIGALKQLRLTLASIPENHPLRLDVAMLTQSFEHYWVVHVDGRVPWRFPPQNTLQEPETPQEPDEHLDHWLNEGATAP
ncbi:hypothetical protein JKG47_11785 [Acidithiobacillus sp. MC6.1]|nr:hypothetical protein [Acidithiobacillus sp. MC6.1]